MQPMLSRSVNFSRAIALSLGLVLVTGCAGEMAKKDKGMAKMSKAHVHIGHVMTGWKDTPEKAGLLPTAIAEAKVAAQHAGFAANKPGDLKWMKAHIGHVLHAVDPGVEPKGPGLGYGVIKAAGGAAKHIGFSAKSEGASGNVKKHAVHVGASTKNVVTWGKLIVRLGKKVKKAKTAAQAAPLVKKIGELAARLAAGDDVNGDGKVTWVASEGGLKEAKKHMGFMMKGEGLKS
ncbi:MAG: hypothetical protein IH994_02545 [Proteobacteria bacterium]|nr:hypothetical protein [Pseudomonadota bacterium]